MNIPSPITITPPSFTRTDGTVRTFQPLTLNSLDITIIDSPVRRTVSVAIRPCPLPLVVWQGDAYDAAGDYTQAQLEARVLELLGSDPAAVLNGLFRRS